MSKVFFIAGALTLGLLGAPAHAVVVNGGFEDTSSSNPTGFVNGNTLASLAGKSGNKSWDVFTAIPGWTTTAGSGIEVQTNGTLTSIDAQSGMHYVELDSHPSPSSNSSMTQTLNLSRGDYLLEFYYSPRNSTANSNGIAYTVMSVLDETLLAGDITGPSVPAGTSVGVWTLISTLFSVKSGDSPVALTFAAFGKQDTLGGFIDSVSLSKVGEVPVPAALPLLATGIAAFGFFARRKRKTA